MKSNILGIIVVIFLFLAPEVLWGQGTTGTWSAITISTTKIINLTGDITVSGTITIAKGGKLTVNANGAERMIKAKTKIKQIFNVEEGGTLILEGTADNRITIDGGATVDISRGIKNATFSGITLDEAILNSGTLTMKYVTIQKVYGNKNGGGILITSNDDTELCGSTTIENCVIKECYSMHGSALHLATQKANTNGDPSKFPINIENTTIENCYTEGTEGGTIRTNGTGVSNLNLKNVKVQNNYTKGSGAGIYWNAAGSASTKCVFDGCTFENNEAENNGGAMMLESTFEFTGATTTVRNNSAKNYGGGIVITSYGGQGFAEQPNDKYYMEYTFGNCLVIDGNSAANGGGISFNFKKYALNKDFISDSKNVPNTLVETTINFNGAEIKNNKATEGEAGGIRIYNNTENWYQNEEAGVKNQRTVKYNVNINGGKITGNSAAGNGGGIYSYKTDIEYKSSESTELVISNNTAEGNFGGGIYVKGGTKINLGKVIMSSNQAPNGSGGAVYLNGNSTSFITNGITTIENNFCKTNGGAVYVSGGAIKMNEPTIQNNGKSDGDIVTENGGAIYVTGDGSGFEATGTKTIIVGNASTGKGGGIYVDGGNVNLTSSTISNNSSKNGGAIYAKGNVKIDGGSTISENYAEEYGGSVYVENGSITIGENSGGELTLSENVAKNGGAFYVNSGNVNTEKCSNAIVENNYSTLEGGAFYVSGGNISMCKTEMSGNGKNNGTVKTTNGGAIALYNGTFEFADGTNIKDNAATGNGGALYVMNNGTDQKTITCTGGSYVNNEAGLGGGIFASGNINLTFAANVQNNKAKNGGGLYLDNGLNMSFGNGLIVGNMAKVEETMASNETNYGVGGGIYVANGTLSFTETNNLGIYNNSASYEAADIYASGSSTKINLPNVKGMNLTGFDVPGSELYWVEDFNEQRYEDALRNLNVNIEELILEFKDNEANKTITEKTCLDLGYDLVFVTLTAEGLEENDGAAIAMSYTNVNDKDIVYRKAFFEENGTRIVGLPSGAWKFEATPWSSKYSTTYNPSHGNNGKIDITRDGTNKIKVTFSLEENMKQIRTYQFKKKNIIE